MSKKKDKNETQIRSCPKCKRETLQVVKLYNPNNADDGEIWECTICEESTAWADEPYKYRK